MPCKWQRDRDDGLPPIYWCARYTDYHTFQPCAPLLLKCYEEAKEDEKSDG